MAQTRILSILWRANSPYGTYVTDDVVDIYYDDNTNLFVVNKNGSPITSGNDIPQYFLYNLQSNFYYKSESMSQTQICDGQDLLRFSRKAAFPYLQYLLLLNHPSCDILGTGLVCDIQFDVTPIITNVSTPTSFDGEIIVEANSSHAGSGIKYKLNSDFEYDDGTAQSSGTFTGLSKGNYLIFAKDPVNCLAVKSVTVGVQKVYDTLYRFEYYSIQSQFHHKTEILQKDFTDDLTEVLPSGNPTIYALRAEGVKDKFLPILPSEMEVNLISQTNFQYQNLYTNDPQKFRVQHSIDTGSGYSIVWIGYILPNQYQEEYKAPPYVSNIIASDGLPLLKNILYLDDDGQKIFGTYKQIDIIAWILRKIDLGINIRSACNLYADGMDSTDSDDPLDQAYVDVSRYYLINEAPTCWDVLTYLLEPYGAQIMQYYNVWNILRLEERNAAFDYREYDQNGVYVSNSSYDPIRDLKTPSNLTGRLLFSNNDQIMRLNPGYGVIQLLYNLGRKDNLIKNGDFQNRRFSVYQQPVLGENNTVDGAIPDLSGFQLVNNEVVVIRKTETIENENIALGLETVESGAYLLSDTIALNTNNDDQISIEYTYKVVADKIYAPFYTKVKIQVVYGSFYLMDTGDWTTTPSIITFYVKPEDYNKYQTWNINVLAPDPSYVGGEDFYIKLYAANMFDWEFEEGDEAGITALSTSGRTLTDIKSGSGIRIYQLKETDQTTGDPPFRLSSVDFDATDNPFMWLWIGTINISSSKTTTLFIDKIRVMHLNNGKLLPEHAAYSQSMENENKLILNKIIYHGSILLNWQTIEDFGVKNMPVNVWLQQVYNVQTYYGANFSSGFSYYSATSAERIYSGYLRDSAGVGYTVWSRDAITESKSIEQIFMDMYTTQYSSPWRSLSGSFTGDIQFSPIDVIKETEDEDRIYFPISLSIDYRYDAYTAELMELKEALPVSGGGAGFEFNEDFNEDFNA